MRNIFCRMALLLAVALAVQAQEYRATIVGVVTDSSGAVVPGARVSVANLETGVTANAEADAQGRYVIPFLVPGQYKVRVQKEGFKAFERSSVEVRIADRYEVNAQLQVGLISEQVTITSAAPLLETSTSSGGQVIDNQRITDLPLNGRNPLQFMSLVTGVTYAGSTLTYFRPFDTEINFSINGGQRGMNDIQIDGVTDIALTYYTTVQQFAYTPPVEATQEFKVQTNTYDAQYGRTAGGVLSLSIKPGGNKLHGSAYEYLRRTDLTANTFANNANRQARPNRKVDQYGFELDGPVDLPKIYKGRDRTFFMFSFEKYGEIQPQPGLGSVPTPAQRAGDFSQTLNSAGKLYTIYDPLTVAKNPAFDSTKSVSLTNLQYLRTPFANNQIPSTRFNQVALNVLKDVPLPNQSGDPNTLLNNWFAGDANSATD